MLQDAADIPVDIAVSAAIGSSAAASGHSRGCEIRVLGYLNYDVKNEKFDRCDVIGLGEAWGRKRNNARRAIRIDDYPWMCGIACELVKGDRPIDRISPYNLFHYGSAVPYFGK